MELWIEARDMDNSEENVKFAESQMIIIVEDVNDNSPEILITYLENDVVADTGECPLHVLAKI